MYSTLLLRSIPLRVLVLVPCLCIFPCVEGNNSYALKLYIIRVRRLP